MLKGSVPDQAILWIKGTPVTEKPLRFCASLLQTKRGTMNLCRSAGSLVFAGFRQALGALR